LTIQNVHRPWTQDDQPVLAGFRAVFVDTRHTRLADIKRPVTTVEIADSECNLFGRSGVARFEAPNLFVA
jgi:hypothetical protein